jgi:threonyl-tRNA synthetase
VLTVSEKSESYGREIEQKLRAAGMRVSGDFRAEKLGSKIRDGQLALVPYMFVVGPRDAEQGTVSVRDRIDGDLGAMTFEAALGKLQAEVASKLVRQVAQKRATGLGERGGAHEY